MHKKARKQFGEDKQTKDLDYWNHALWSDKTKINLFGSDSVKRVLRQPGEEYKDKCVPPTVKHGGGGVMVWGCMSAASTEEQQFIILTLISSSSPFGYWAARQYSNMIMTPAQTHLQDDHCLAKEAEGKGDGLAKRVSRPKL